MNINSNYSFGGNYNVRPQAQPRVNAPAAQPTPADIGLGDTVSFSGTPDPEGSPEIPSGGQQQTQGFFSNLFGKVKDWWNGKRDDKISDEPSKGSVGVGITLPDIEVNQTVGFRTKISAFFHRLF